MKKIIIILVVSMVSVLAGCKQEVITDEDFLLKCIQDVSDDDSCIAYDNRYILDKGITEYFKTKEYEYYKDDVSYRVKIDYSSKIYILIKVSSEDLEFSKELYKGTVELMEDFYQMLVEYDLDSDFRLTVDFTNSTDTGIDNIRVQKATYESINTIELFYRLDEITLNTIVAEKDVITSVLNDSAGFDITLRLVEEDFSIDSVLNFQHFEMMLLKGDNQILYNFAPLTTLIVHNFTNEEFYQTFFSEFPEYSYLYSEE